MKQIIGTINAHEDGVRCGECRFSRNARAYTRQCFLLHRRIPGATCRADAMRLPECIALELALSKLVAAGNNMVGYILWGDGTMGDSTEAWDAALAAIDAAVAKRLG